MSSEHLTIGAVIADLPAFERKEVTVRGCLTVQRENHSIADAHGEDPARRLWVVFHHASLGMREKDVAGFDRKTVVATGIVRREKKGHFSLFSASLTIHRLCIA